MSIDELNGTETEQPETDKHIVCEGSGSIENEWFRIVSEQCGRRMIRYDIGAGTGYFSGAVNNGFGCPDVVSNMTEYFTSNGIVASENVGAFIEFFRRIKSGESPITNDFLMSTSNQTKRWFRFVSTTLYGADNIPHTAIISYIDCTDQREREVIYNKWQQELGKMSNESIGLYEWNLTWDRVERVYGALLTDYSELKTDSFDARTEYFMSRYVYYDDRHAYAGLMKREHLLEAYIDKNYFSRLDYRYINKDDSISWRRVSVQLVPYPDTQEIKAFIINQDIDKEKQRELNLVERSERDGMTGVLNRTTFIDRVSKLIDSAPGKPFVLLLLDLDGFKNVNDLLGHTAGDKVLIEYVNYMRSILRVSDLIGRIDGDEFMVCIPGLSDTNVIARKADRLCSLLCCKQGAGLTISVSIGIVLYPQNGMRFQTLYKNSDTAMYYAKNAGKNRFVFYNELMKPNNSTVGDIDKKDKSAYGDMPENPGSACLTILIADSDPEKRKFIRNALEIDAYRIVEAENGEQVLARLSDPGSVDIVILDLDISDPCGYDVMIRMKETPLYKHIPVMASADAYNEESQLKAFGLGAADYLIPPYNRQLIRLRVGNIAERIRNERFTMERATLELQIRQQEQALMAAERDSLTGLYRRSAFLKKRRSSFAQASREHLSYLV